MNAENISFSEKHRALRVYINTEAELVRAIETLKLNCKRPVVVVVGGADKASNYHQKIIKQSTRTIARAAEESQAIVLSGGTNSGVMAAIGQARVENNYSFPLVGVAVKNLVTWPGNPASQEKGTPLEPHHTHFLLVPGNEWGDESFWIAKLVPTLAWKYPSVTVLSNGGTISLRDVTLSVKARRPVVILEGTGRLADKLARMLTPSKLIKIIPANKDTVVFETVHESLVASQEFEISLEMAGVTHN